jgi:hypothetical protein
MGIHALNTATFDAVLPMDRERAIEKVDDMIAELDDQYLDSVPERHSI